MDLENYYTGKQAAKILKVCQHTLRNWSKEGKLEVYRTPGNKRMYNVGKYLKDNNIIVEEIKETITEKLTIGYIRVSSKKQIDDLERQRKELLKFYPDIEIIEDIGSGLTLTKRSLVKLNTILTKGQDQELKKLLI
jgi:excisionase family DNA binding protein